MFADDILLFLDGTLDNMDRALNVISRFGVASGAKLNLHKSVGIWLSHSERTWHWGEEARMKWLQPGTLVTLSDSTCLRRKKTAKCSGKSENTYRNGPINRYPLLGESWWPIKLCWPPSGTWPHVQTSLDKHSG